MPDLSLGRISIRGWRGSAQHRQSRPAAGRRKRAAKIRCKECGPLTIHISVAPAYRVAGVRRNMRRRTVSASLVLVLTIFLPNAARSEQGFKLDHAEDEAMEGAISRNEWISKLRYVTGVGPGWELCRDRSNKVTSVEDVILVTTDTEDHVTQLEKKLPGSLEGLPVVVGVDRSKQWELEAQQMRAKVQPVIDDPANKWILKIPHVTRMLPATVNTEEGQPSSPAVGIAVDSGRTIKEVKSKIPTIGGFPTTFGWVDDGLSECFTNTGKGCDDDETDDSDDD